MCIVQHVKSEKAEPKESVSQAASTAPPPVEKGAAKIDADGTATGEAFVGDDVEWTITVTNKGMGDVANLEANTNFGGLELVSIIPTPTEQPIKMVQRFGPLKSGQSVTITYKLLASKVGVAEGILSFYDEDKSGDDDVFLKPQTIVR